jgi:hypothetical protein
MIAIAKWLGADSVEWITNPETSDVIVDFCHDPDCVLIRWFRGNSSREISAAIRRFQSTAFFLLRVGHGRW